MVTTPLLEVQDLRTCFHIPEGTVHAVNGITFHVSEGETLAIVGESGCGKSVSMMSILGLIPIPPGKITSGQAIYRSRDLLRLTETEMEAVRGKEIAMIFQDPMTSLNPVLTIGRQITEALRLHLKMDNAAACDRAVEMLDMVGIAEASRRLCDYPHQFSGGMRQRVMIAMALACEPSLLIADEPTTALDVTIQAQIVELVTRLRDQSGMAVIWITHDLGVVARIADRVIVMYAGQIVEGADVLSLYQDPLHPYTQALLGALPRADRRRDKRLKSIPGAPPSLLVEPRGCPFAARCEYVQDCCRHQTPPLLELAPAHTVACWVDIKTGALR
ncbi:MAG: ABC transporter ATP-binding protein [Anaerolineales bacterium]|nr:ABC transporter ATP-binding protein [Anaerolineales bacterium]